MSCQTRKVSKMGLQRDKMGVVDRKPTCMIYRRFGLEEVKNFHPVGSGSRLRTGWVHTQSKFVGPYRHHILILFIVFPLKGVSWSLVVDVEDYSYCLHRECYDSIRR